MGNREDYLWSLDNYIFPAAPVEGQRFYPTVIFHHLISHLIETLFFFLFSFLQISLKNAESQGNPKHPSCSKGDCPGTPSLPSLLPAPARPREQEPSSNTW